MGKKQMGMGVEIIGQLDKKGASVERLNVM